MAIDQERLGSWLQSCVDVFTVNPERAIRFTVKMTAGILVLAMYATMFILLTVLSSPLLYFKKWKDLARPIRKLADVISAISSLPLLLAGWFLIRASNITFGIFGGILGLVSYPAVVYFTGNDSSKLPEYVPPEDRSQYKHPEEACFRPMDIIGDHAYYDPYNNPCSFRSLFYSAGGIVSVNYYKRLPGENYVIPTCGGEVFPMDRSFL